MPKMMRSSSRYDPAHDPAGPPCPACGTWSCGGECPEMAEAMRPDFIQSIDSYTGYPVYSVNSARGAEMMRQYDASDVPLGGNLY
jgi:hypothetical protein